MKTTIQAPSSALDYGFSQDGTIFYCRSQDNRIHLWQVDSGQPLAKAQTQRTIQRFCLSPDNTTLAVKESDSERLRFWNVLRGQWSGEIPYNIGYVFDISFASDNKTVALVIARDSDVTGPTLLRRRETISAHGPSPPPGKAEGGSNGSADPVLVPNSGIVLFDIASKRCVKTLESQGKDTAWAIKAAFSPDGRWIAGVGGVDRRTRSGASCIEFCDEYLLAIWNARSGKQVWLNRQLTGRSLLSFAPRSDLLLCEERYIELERRPWRLRNISDASLSRNAEGVEGWSVEGFFDATGKNVLISGMQSGETILDIRTGKALARFSRRQKVVRQRLAYNARRQLVAVTDDVKTVSRITFEKY